MLPEHNHFATTLQLFPSQTSSSGPKYLIFNITGNPGLIAYYTQFLTSLRNRLESTAPKAEFEIYSRSLSGFDVNDHKADDSYGVEHAIKEQDRSRPPFSLEAQIEHAIIALKQVVAASSREANGKEPSVILVGHSVGTYMILEIISRLRTNAAKDGYHSTINVVGGICLFATVTHLAQSKSGKIFSPLMRIPYFPFLMHCLVKLLTLPLPYFALYNIVKFVTRMPPYPAEITTAFLTSPKGVYQALYMARDELRDITTDKWDSEIWGAAYPAETPRPKLFFYFGEQDHWVANETRDQMIAARAYSGTTGEEWKPRMEIDTGGVPHGFVIRHSNEVAEKVAGWIGEIVKQDR